MVTKNNLVIILKKLKANLAVLTIFVGLSSTTTRTIKFLELKTFTFHEDIFKRLRITSNWRIKRAVFTVMVLIVTTLVVSYREIYIEHYNNKKFFFLLLIFIASMIILSVRRSIISTIVGWEFLGVTSLCLIIFYPNKTSKINSILTIIFNRIGDVILILIVGAFLLKNERRLEIQRLDKKFCLIIALCSLTKRAQFPLSAWLPAAISAPTPISAIVHSSTLVTAGIFLNVTAWYSLNLNRTVEILISIRTIRFLIAGIIANLELDFKKIIAYSTIRQIRIIIIIAILNQTKISLTHITYHAFFKTLLFCTAGLLFVSLWGTQKYRKMNLRKTKTSSKIILLSRIYAISGLAYSSSFYTKDLFLETKLFEAEIFLIITVIVLARILTTFYRIKIIFPLISYSNNKRKIAKKSGSKIMNSIVLAVILSERLIMLIRFKERFPLANTIEILSLFLIIRRPIFIKKIKISSSFILNINSRVFHIKYQTYSFYPKILEKDFLSQIFQVDTIFVKKKYIMTILLNEKKRIFIITLIAVVFFFCY